MTDISSPSINDLVQQHAYRSYEESDLYPQDLEQGIRHVRINDSGSAARKLIELGFERGFRARDEQVANLDNAYGELLTSASVVQGTVGTYARIVAAIQSRLSEQDAVDRIPTHIAADLDQIIFEGNLDLTSEF